MASLPPEVQQILVQIEQLRQQYQIVQSQRINLEARYNEVKNALSELEKSQEKSVYKSIGAILVRKNKDEVIKELKEEKELLEVRINAVKKQEQSISDKMRALENKFKSLMGAQKNA